GLATRAAGLQERLFQLEQRVLQFQFAKGKAHRPVCLACRRAHRHWILASDAGADLQIKVEVAHLLSPATSLGYCTLVASPVLLRSQPLALHAIVPYHPLQGKRAASSGGTQCAGVGRELERVEQPLPQEGKASPPVHDALHQLQFINKTLTLP